MPVFIGITPILAADDLPSVLACRQSTASPAAWAAAGAVARMLRDAPLPPWRSRKLDDVAADLDGECEWLVAASVLPADLVTRNRQITEAALRPWTPVFMHGDLQAAHVFVDDDEVTGVLDRSEAGQGDAMFDLAVLTLGGAGRPMLSPDGRYVAFSGSPDLVGAAPTGPTAVLLRDLWERTTRLVSATPDGRPADGSSDWPALSADGRYILFSSDAANLVGHDRDRHTDVFVRDLVTGHTAQLSPRYSGSGVAYSGTASISANGRYAAYLTHPLRPAPGYQVTFTQAVLRDLVTGRTVRLTNDRQAVGGESGGMAFSDDGRYVVFPERDTVPPAASVGEPGLLLRDAWTGTTRLVASGPERSAPIPSQAEALELAAAGHDPQRARAAVTPAVASWTVLIKESR